MSVDSLAGSIHPAGAAPARWLESSIEAVPAPDTLIVTLLFAACITLALLYTYVANLHAQLSASLDEKMPDTLAEALFTEDNAGASGMVPELLQIGAEGWTLAAEVQEPSLLKVYTKLHDGVFSLRLVCEIDAGIAEIMALPREADLIPTWHPFVSWAQVERLRGPLELWADAITSPPWPIPEHKVLLHARLLNCMEHDSSFVCIARTPDTFDAPVGAPVAACKREIPLELGVCRLMPQAVPGAPRTSVDTMFRLDLTRISYLGGAKALPQWLMNMVLYLVLPFVWRHALKAITDGFSHAERPLAKRVIEDSSGVYGLIRRSTGQSPMLKA